MRKIVLILSLLLLCGCTPKKEDNKSASTSKMSKEKELYLNHCANCHGGNLEGSFGPPLNGVDKKYTKNQVLEIIQKGKDRMPAQDYISKDEQEELAKWLTQK